MSTTSPRSAVRATRRTSKAFNNATLSLTAWYAVGVLVLLVLFNTLIYFIFTQKIHIEEEGENGALVVENELVEDDEIDDDMPIISDSERGGSIDDDLLAAQAFASAVIMCLVVVLAYILSRKTLRPIEESYERQQRFVADAAHELRTPLAVLQAAAEVALSKDQSSVGYRTFISDMLDESKRLSKLSDDLLVLARGTSVAGASESIVLSKVTQDMCNLIRPYAEQKGLTLVYEGEKNNILVTGMAADIHRALMNVITNAVDYTAKGSVTVRLREEGHFAVVRVSDTGVGIAPHDLPHVFERFYKADASRTIRESGAGLGLAIVKEIVERHGGSVAIESTVGHGTAVILRFHLVA